MKKITMIGAGKVGSLVALLLQQTGKYQLQLLSDGFAGVEPQRLFKLYPELKSHAIKIEITNKAETLKTVKQFKPEAIISCLPFFLTKYAAEIAKKIQCHYFDLTEDTATTAYIQNLATNAITAFVPQCGLAPGMVGLIANDLMQQFTKVDSAQLRVGALPQFSNHGLKYALTWSTDGLLNEYDQPCRAILDGRKTTLSPLEYLETIELFGEQYEAFNTSGGLGSLVDLYHGKINKLNYKTIRYPGHCEKIKFLMRDLKLRLDKPLLKSILENAVPRSYQDLVLLAIQVIGIKDKQFQAQTYIKKIMPDEIAGMTWSALQVATASGICAVVDLILFSQKKYQGFIYQEQLSFPDILKTSFANYYKIEG